MKKLIVSLLLSAIVGITLQCQSAIGVVNTTAVPERFPANGSSTTFNFTFRLTDQTEMQALVRADATGIDTALELNVDYTLSATNNDFSSGGTLTTDATYASGNTLILHREALRTQTVNLIQGQAMPAEPTEITFDKQMMAIQDIDKNMRFAITVPKGDPTTALSLELSSSVDRAGKFLTFDANGNPLAADGTTGVVVTAYAETYLDDPSEATFKATTNLEAGTDLHAYTANGNTILTDAGVLSIAGLTTLADRMIYTTASDTYAVATLTASGRALIDDASTSAQRTTLGLAIGSDVHAYTANGNTILTDAGVLSIAGLTTAADKMIYTTASDTYATTDLTSFSRTLLDDANAAEARATLGVTSATNAINEDGSTVYTSTGAGFKDEDDMSSDSAVATVSQQSVKKYIDDLIAAKVTLSVYTNEDSEPTAMVKAHAYKAATDGQVTAYVLASAIGGQLKGYVGTDNDPTDENLVQSASFTAGGAIGTLNMSFLVAKDEYFELTTNSSNAVTIMWKSFGTLSKPIDQD